MDRMKIATAGIFAATMLATSMPALSQEKNNQFKEIDSMIKKMESNEVEQKKEVQLVELPKDDTPLPQKVSPEMESDLQSEASVSKVKKEVKEAEPQFIAKRPVPDVRLTDLPPNTRFNLKRQVFIPAYKNAVMFVDGKVHRAIDSTTNPTDALLENPNSSPACIVKSSKSYVMMHGTQDNPSKATYFEVAGVQFLKGKNASGENVFIAEVGFKKKKPKNAAVSVEDGVEVGVVCQIPVELHDNIKRYNLNDLNQGLGGIFDFDLPQFIEI